MQKQHEQIEPADCPFTLHGEKLAYLSRGKLRMVAKQLGVKPDGMKFELYTHIVTHLEQSGAKAEVSKALPKKGMNLRDKITARRRMAMSL